MTWATWPIAAWAAGIAIPTLLILYFLKLRRRDLDVSTTLLWKKSIQDLQANAPFQKLRRNILLLLQLLALAAALAALGQPELKATAGTGKRHVILIDRSGSMNATDGDPKNPGAMSRLEAAKKAAKDFVEALPEPGFFDDPDSGDQVMVIAFDSAADRRQSFTSTRFKAEIGRAIDSIGPTDGPSSIQDAIKVAKAYSPSRVFQENVGFVSRGTPINLHLFSDGRLPDSARLAPTPEELGATELSPDDQVIYHAIGAPDAPNLGITGLRAERAFDNPGKLTIFVGIQSICREARSVDVELSIDNHSVAVQPVPLGAATTRAIEVPAAGTSMPPTGEIDPATGGVVFSLDRPEGGVAVARLLKNEPDALPTDDLAYVVIPPAKRLAVALVTDGNLFLDEALGGMRLSRLAKMKPAIFQQMLEGQKVDGASLGDFDVVILDRFLPSLKDPAGKPVPVLPPGRALVLGAVPPPPMGLIDDGPGEAALIVDWVREHPSLKYAGLAELNIGKSRKTSIAPDSPVLMIAQLQSGGGAGPAIVEAANESTRALIVTFDPGDTDWPLKPGFVLFLASSLTYLAHDTGEAAGAGALGDMVRPGQTLVQRLPVGASAVRLTLPDSTHDNLVPAPDGRIAYGPIRKIGFYSISWDGPALPTDPVVDGRPRRVTAANLLDPEESLIATRTALDLPGRVVNQTTEASHDALRKLWPWLLLGALAVVMLEWFVYNRKVHV